MVWRVGRSETPQTNKTRSQYLCGSIRIEPAVANSVCEAQNYITWRTSNQFFLDAIFADPFLSLFLFRRSRDLFTNITHSIIMDETTDQWRERELFNLLVQLAFQHHCRLPGKMFETCVRSTLLHYGGMRRARK